MRLGPQLGQVGEGRPGVAGPDVRERLGDRVDLTRWQAQGRTDVAYGVPHPVGVHHRDADAAVTPETVEDRLVDLAPPSGLDVDVDVGEGLTQGGEEALHEQAVAQGLDAGHPEHVQHQAAGS